MDACPGFRTGGDRALRARAFGPKIIIESSCVGCPCMRVVFAGASVAILCVRPVALDSACAPQLSLPSARVLPPVWLPRCLPEALSDPVAGLSG